MSRIGGTCYVKVDGQQLSLTGGSSENPRLESGGTSPDASRQPLARVGVVN